MFIEEKSVVKMDVHLVPFDIFPDKKLSCMVIKPKVEDNLISNHQFFSWRYWNHESAIDGTPSWMGTCHWVRFPRPRWSVTYFLEPYTNLEAVAGRNCINTKQNGHTIWTIFFISFISRTAKSFSPSIPISIPWWCTGWNFTGSGINIMWTKDSDAY